jgi:DNA polymerase elongation subunit (family B)
MKIDIVGWHSEDVNRFTGCPINVKAWRPPPEKDLEVQESDAESISEEEIVDSGPDDDDDDDDPIASNFEFAIFLFGREQESGNTVCLQISNIKPELYVSFPDPTLQNYLKWSNAISKTLVARSKTGEWINCSDHIIKSQNWHDGVVRRKTMWGFTNGEVRTFLRFQFRSHWAWKKVGNALAYKRSKFEKIMGDYSLFESQSDPLLTLCHENDIKMGGSVEVCDEFLTKRKGVNTTCHSEWDLQDPSKLIPLHQPRISKNFVQLCFDIETFSHDGSFPSPRDIRNPVFQVGITVKRGITHDCQMTKHIINLGPCTDIEDVDLICVDSEVELLVEFSKFVRRIDPDIIWAFNGDKFDWKYIMKRARLLGLTPKDVPWTRFQFSRFQSYKCYLTSENFSNRANGDNRFHRVDIPGRLNLDLLLHVLQSGNFSSYKLDNIAKQILGESKDDIKPKQIFEYYASQDPALISTIARYCVQDTVLVQRLVDRLECFTALVEMSSVMFVPVPYLLNKGQSIRVASLVGRKAAQNGFLVPDIRTSDGLEDRGNYQGATVLDPDPGIYTSPVVVLDFASLYPTIQMAYCICWSTIVLDQSYANCKDIDYQSIDWTDEETGVYHCYTFAQVVGSNKEVKCVLPELQKELFEARKAIKRELKTVDAGSEHALVLSLREKAVKISMNSCYGFTNAFRLPLQQLGSSTTAYGRAMIARTRTFMETEFPLEIDVPIGQFKVVAGDSIAGWSPMLVREFGNRVCIRSMDYIASRIQCWIKANDGKEMADATCLYLETWTEQGWTPVKTIIRHYTSKPLVRVVCPDGIVDVTTDHSLVTSKGQPVRPWAIRPDDNLLTSFPNESIFCGDFFDMDATVNIAETLMFYPSVGGVPDEIMNSTTQVKEKFLEIVSRRTRQSIIVETQFATMTWYTLLSVMDYKVELWCMPDDIAKNHYRLHWFTKDIARVQNGATPLRKIFNLSGYNRMVYDLTTVNHHFHAGCGSLIVHNTDSVFVHMKETTVEQASKWAKMAEIRLTRDIFARNPIAMEYEKTYLPLVVEKKKRYFGLIRVDDDKPALDFIESVTMEKNKLVLHLRDNTHVTVGTVDFKGLAIKRRNYCQLVKTLFTKLICNVLGFDRLGVDKVIQDVRLTILDLLHHRISVDDLTVTYKLKAKYANENLPHIQLARKMRMRDPGSAPGIGERYGLVILANGNLPISMRSEDPDYVKENGLLLDAVYYLQHLRRPMVAINIVLGNGVKCQALFDAAELLAKRQLQGNHALINRSLEEELDSIARRLENNVSHKQLSQISNKTKTKKLDTNQTRLDSFFLKTQPK